MYVKCTMHFMLIYAYYNIALLDVKLPIFNLPVTVFHSLFLLPFSPSISGFPSTKTWIITVIQCVSIQSVIAYKCSTTCYLSCFVVGFLSLGITMYEKSCRDKKKSRGTITNTFHTWSIQFIQKNTFAISTFMFNIQLCSIIHFNIQLCSIIYNNKQLYHKIAACKTYGYINWIDLFLTYIHRLCAPQRSSPHIPGPALLA